MVGQYAPRGTADLAACEEQVDGLERGILLPGMTLAESVAHLASLTIARDWPTLEDRRRAGSLVLRLAALGWL
jgi:hypothetical protein